MPCLSIHGEDQGQLIKVILAGVINEEADFSVLLQQVRPQKEILFDLAGISRISSWGIQKWLELISMLQEQQLSFSFARCSVAMVHQFSTMIGLSGGGRIVSVMVPFLCEDCEYQVETEVHLDGSGQRPALPHMRCLFCKEPMVFDDLPEVFFRFVDALL